MVRQLCPASRLKPSRAQRRSRSTREDLPVELTLLGTGAPGGLPRPGCPCAACATALGEARAPRPRSWWTASCCSTSPPARPSRPPAPGTRSAECARCCSPTRTTGPAVEVPAGLPQPGRVADGRELALLTGHRVRAVALDAPGTGYEVTGTDGERLLYLPPGGAPAGLAGGAGGPAVRDGRRGRHRAPRRARPAPGRGGGRADHRRDRGAHRPRGAAGRRADAPARGRRGAGRAGRVDARGRRLRGRPRRAAPHPRPRRRPLGQVGGGRAAPGGLPRGAVRGHGGDQERGHGVGRSG